MVSAVRLSRQVVGRRAAGRLGVEMRRTAARGGGVFDCNAGLFGYERRVDHGRGGRVGWRKGSDVLPVSIIIGGWLTGRRFAPHNSRRPIILPRLPCTNSYITCRHVPPYRYIIAPMHHHSFSDDYRGLRKTAHTRAVCIVNMTIMRMRLSVRVQTYT